ncbi:MAG: hypothetical protein IIZ57_08955 [Solobacterium sp.]|nr:hypothetical protein [Solobacterium sp.]
MSRFSKQVLAVILAVQTCMAGLPTPVFAEENFPEETAIPTEDTTEEVEETVSIQETTEEEPELTALTEETEQGSDEPEEPAEPEIIEEAELKPVFLYPADELVIDGEDLVLSLSASEGFSLPLTVLVNGETYETEAGEDGSYVLRLPLSGFIPGSYPVSLTFAGNDEFASAELSFDITIEEQTGETDGIEVNGYTVTFLKAEEVPEPSEEPGEIGDAEEYEEPDISVGYQINAVPDVYDNWLYFSSVQYDSSMDDGTFMVQYKLDYSLQNVYLLAVRDGKTWFVDHVENPGSGTHTRYVKFELPAGEYELRIGLYTLGDLLASEDYYKLVVFDAPKVVGTGNYKGTEYGYIDIDISPLTSKEYFINPGLSESTVWLYATEDHPDWTRRTLSAVKSYSSDGIYRLELGDPNAYSGTGTYKDFPYGPFDLSWKVHGGGSVIGKNIFSNSSTVHVDIMQDIKPKELHAEIETGNGSSYLYYKGQTAQIKYWFGNEYDSETDPDQRVDDLDRRVTFTSSNTKQLTVDANGKVTVVSVPKPGEPQFEPKIIITSKADPTVSFTLTAVIFPLASGKADMKVLYDGKEYSTFEFTLGKQTASSHLVDVVFRIAEPHSALTGLPVCFNSDGKNLTFLTDPAHPSTSGAEPVYLGSVMSDGTAHAVVRGWEPGSHKVTATTMFGKSASVTININGVTDSLAGGATKNSEYFVNGKNVTGWLRYDRMTDQYTTGKNVFKAPINPSYEYIYYIDPSTKKVVTGDPWNSLPDTVKKIDGKLYVFNAGRGLKLKQGSDGYSEEGWIMVEHEQLDTYPVYLNKNGVVQTGWVNTKDEGWHYFHPDYGYLMMDSFVPAQNGKGTTYIDNYGQITYGIFVPTKETLKITERDGLYRINSSSEYYWVKDGAFYTGWLYLHYSTKTGFVWNTTAKGALEKMYFDPNQHGRMKIGTFTVGGKSYYSDISKYPDFCSADGYDYYVSVQTLANLFEKYPEKYGKNPLDGRIIDANGAIVFNKLVRIAQPNGGGYDTHYVYAGDDGKPVTDTWQAVDGKMYYFGTNGWLEMANTTYPSLYYFYDEAYSISTVYFMLKNIKKPTEGYYYYDSHDNQLTSLLLYDSSMNPLGMLDDKGDLVTEGIADVRYSLSTTDKHTMIVDANGNIVRSPDSSYGLCVNVKGKTYVVDLNGNVQITVPEPVYAWDQNQNVKGYVLPGKNGVLYKKTFATVNDGSFGQYKVWLDENGFAAGNSSMIYEYDVKYFGNYANGKSWLTFDTGKNYDGFVIPGKTLKPGTGKAYTAGWQGSQYDSPVYMNKDGSIKTGFVKHGSNTWYLAAAPYGAVNRIYSDPLNLDGTSRTVLFRINGKTYYFDNIGLMVTGWVHFEHALVIDITDYIFEYPNAVNYDDIYMYFSPKDGHAVTGKNTVPVPQLFDGKISLADEADYFANGEKRVNTTPASRTLYFTSEGMLIHDTEALISKKLLKLGPDGTTDPSAHWEDAAKSRYILKSGALASGRTKVDGIYYYFDTQTGYKVVNQLRKSGSKWYYYNEYGKQDTPIMGTGKQVRLPEYMENEWGGYAEIFIDSTNNKKLTALWNKDGSLAKIVYTDTNKPASGESISFGLWDISDSYMCQRYISSGLNGYVLDSKGLPKTGIVSGFNFNTDSDPNRYTLNVEKDGRKVYTTPGISLVKIGKKYYVMQEGLILEQQSGVIEINDWSSLPAADQKTLNELAAHAETYGVGLYVMLNNDGSTAVNTNRYVTIYFGYESYLGDVISGNMRSNRFGVILDVCGGFYRVGKKTYVITAYQEYHGTFSVDTYINKYVEYDIQQIEVTLKFNENRLLGIYDRTTGKGLNGVYIIPLSSVGEMVWLKNGQPQSGNQTFNFYGRKWQFYVDPDMIGTPNIFH